MGVGLVVVGAVLGILAVGALLLERYEKRLEEAVRPRPYDWRKDRKFTRRLFHQQAEEVLTSAYDPADDRSRDVALRDGAREGEAGAVYDFRDGRA